MDRIKSSQCVPEHKAADMGRGRAIDQDLIISRPFGFECVTGGAELRGRDASVAAFPSEGGMHLGIGHSRGKHSVGPSPAFRYALTAGFLVIPLYDDAGIRVNQRRPSLTSFDGRRPRPFTNGGRVRNCFPAGAMCSLDSNALSRPACSDRRSSA